MNCSCGSGRDSWLEYDTLGIPLCRVCDECVLGGYDQSDVDEPIEADDWGDDWNENKCRTIRVAPRCESCGTEDLLFVPAIIPASVTLSSSHSAQRKRDGELSPVASSDAELVDVLNAIQLDDGMFILCWCKRCRAAWPMTPNSNTNRGEA